MGVMDGRADAKASPDPDRRQDLAMTWLLAGSVAGALAGAVAWLISLFYKVICHRGPINELTTFAASPRSSSSGRGRREPWAGGCGPAAGEGTGATPRLAAEHESGPPITDVFSDVRADDSPTRSQQPEAQTAAVATVEREAPTEVIRAPPKAILIYRRLSALTPRGVDQTKPGDAEGQPHVRLPCSARYRRPQSR